ncbi:ShlB/FhaC/HecB family hemolysin secretion/activation protein [Chitinimonas sp. PSY-7]|uniref:ShlB/FhaC/HecB family hemolysin secretion/activation protein n=1 Tax=Chitinimonas sp. PSY-7 TaxID=3459088 RepID=UPI00403FE44A
MKPFATAFLLALMSAAIADESPKFAIKEFLVKGNTVLPQASIDAALQPFSGPNRDFADVQHALETLEGLYRRAGYGSLQVYLPEQELSEGQVLLQVVEPRVDKVRIEGNQYFGADNIRRAMPALRDGEVPNTAALSKDLRLANESPSRRMTVSLQAGEKPQTVDAVLRVVDEKPQRFFVAADNTGTKETGRTRLSLGYQHANLFDRDHVLTTQFTTSPKEFDQVKIFGLGYKLPLYGWGDSMSLFAGYSNVSSAVLQGLFNTSGKGTVAGVRYNYGLPTRGAYQQKLVFGLDSRRFESETSFIGAIQGKQRYTIRPVSVGYQMQSQSADWSYDGNVTFSRNLPAENNLALRSGRQGTGIEPIDNDHYQILRYGVNGYLGLPADWLAHASLNGQKTTDALPSGEFFGIGGANSVRGYDERVLSNDEGMNASLELYTPDLAKYLKWESGRLQFLGFFDWGSLSRKQALPGEQTSAKLAGAGIGLRLSVGKMATVKLDLAKARKDGGGQKKGDNQAHASAILTY